MIVDDFNFHVYDKNNKSASDFLELLELFNLKQHDVCVPTYQPGHTLDLLITRNDDGILNSIWTHDPAISDHFYINCSINFSKPGVSRKEIEFRKIKSINIECFRNDIAVSFLVESPSDDLTELVSQYDTVLSAILDNHVPIKKRIVTIGPAVSWYTVLENLNHYGIRGIVSDWFSSYLHKRVQTTQISSFISEKENTLCGVRQGSVLGPLLFLLYINDIYNASDKLKFYLFADDTNFLYSDKNLKSLEIAVNAVLL